MASLIDEPDSSSSSEDDDGDPDYLPTWCLGTRPSTAGATATKQHPGPKANRRSIPPSKPQKDPPSDPPTIPPKDPPVGAVVVPNPLLDKGGAVVVPNPLLDEGGLGIRLSATTISTKDVEMSLESHEEDASFSGAIMDVVDRTRNVPDVIEELKGCMLVGNKAKGRAMIEKLKLLIDFSAEFFNSLFKWTEDVANLELARGFLQGIYDRDLTGMTHEEVQNQLGGYFFTGPCLNIAEAMAGSKGPCLGISEALAGSTDAGIQLKNAIAYYQSSSLKINTDRCTQRKDLMRQCLGCVVRDARFADKNEHTNWEYKFQELTKSPNDILEEMKLEFPIEHKNGIFREPFVHHFSVHYDVALLSGLMPATTNSKSWFNIRPPDEYSGLRRHEKVAKDPRLRILIIQACDVRLAALRKEFDEKYPRGQWTSKGAFLCRYHVRLSSEVVNEIFIKCEGEIANMSGPRRRRVVGGDKGLIAIGNNTKLMFLEGDTACEVQAGPPRKRKMLPGINVWNAPKADSDNDDDRSSGSEEQNIVDGKQRQKISSGTRILPELPTSEVESIFESTVGPGRRKYRLKPSLEVIHCEHFDDSREVLALASTIAGIKISNFLREAGLPLDRILKCGPLVRKILGLYKDPSYKNLEPFNIENHHWLSTKDRKDRSTKKAGIRFALGILGQQSVVSDDVKDAMLLHLNMQGRFDQDRAKEGGANIHANVFVPESTVGRDIMESAEFKDDPNILPRPGGSWDFVPNLHMPEPIKHDDHINVPLRDRLPYFTLGKNKKILAQHGGISSFVKLLMTQELACWFSIIVNEEMKKIVHLREDNTMGAWIELYSQGNPKPVTLERPKETVDDAYISALKDSVAKGTTFCLPQDDGLPRLGPELDWRTEKGNGPSPSKRARTIEEERPLTVRQLVIDGFGDFVGISRPLEEGELKAYKKLQEACTVAEGANPVYVPLPIPIFNSDINRCGIGADYGVHSDDDTILCSTMAMPNKILSTGAQLPYPNQMSVHTWVSSFDTSHVDTAVRHGFRAKSDKFKACTTLVTRNNHSHFQPPPAQTSGHHSGGPAKRKAFLSLKVLPLADLPAGLVMKCMFDFHKVYPGVAGVEKIPLTLACNPSVPFCMITPPINFRSVSTVRSCPLGGHDAAVYAAGLISEGRGKLNDHTCYNQANLINVLFNRTEPVGWKEPIDWHKEAGIEYFQKMAKHASLPWIGVGSGNTLMCEDELPLLDAGRIPKLHKTDPGIYDFCHKQELVALGEFGNPKYKLHKDFQYEDPDRKEGLGIPVAVKKMQLFFTSKDIALNAATTEMMDKDGIALRIVKSVKSTTAAKCGEKRQTDFVVSDREPYFLCPNRRIPFCVGQTFNKRDCKISENKKRKETTEESHSIVCQHRQYKQIDQRRLDYEIRYGAELQHLCKTENISEAKLRSLEDLFDKCGGYAEEKSLDVLFGELETRYSHGPELFFAPDDQDDAKQAKPKATGNPKRKAHQAMIDDIDSLVQEERRHRQRLIDDIVDKSHLRMMAIADKCTFEGTTEEIILAKKNAFRILWEEQSRLPCCERLATKTLWTLSDEHFRDISQIAHHRATNKLEFRKQLTELFGEDSIGYLLFQIAVRMNMEPLVQVGSSGSSVVPGETGLTPGQSSKTDAALTSAQMQTNDNVTNSRLNSMLETGNAVLHLLNLETILSNGNRYPNITGYKQGKDRNPIWKDKYLSLGYKRAVGLQKGEPSVVSEIVARFPDMPDYVTGHLVMTSYNAAGPLKLNWVPVFNFFAQIRHILKSQETSPIAYRTVSVRDDCMGPSVDTDFIQDSLKKHSDMNICSTAILCGMKGETACSYIRAGRVLKEFFGESDDKRDELLRTYLGALPAGEESTTKIVGERYFHMPYYIEPFEYVPMQAVTNVGVACRANEALCCLDVEGLPAGDLMTVSLHCRSAYKLPIGITEKSTPAGSRDLDLAPNYMRYNGGIIIEDHNQRHKNNGSLLFQKKVIKLDQMFFPGEETIEGAPNSVKEFFAEVRKQFWHDDGQDGNKGKTLEYVYTLPEVGRSHPEVAKVLWTLLHMGMCNRETGLIPWLNLFPKFKKERAEKLKLREPATMNYLPTPDEAVAFADFIGASVKHLGYKQWSKFQHDQHPNQIPPEFTKGEEGIRTAQAYIISRATKGELLTNYFMKAPSPTDQGSDRLKVSRLLGKVLHDSGSVGQKSAKFVIHHSMLDVISVVPGVFGADDAKAVAYAFGSEVGLPMSCLSCKEVIKKDDYRTMLVYVHEGITVSIEKDHINNPIMLMMYNFVKEEGTGNLISALTGDVYSYSHTEHPCCKCLIHYARGHTSRNKSAQTQDVQTCTLPLAGLEEDKAWLRPLNEQCTIITLAVHATPACRLQGNFTDQMDYDEKKWKGGQGVDFDNRKWEKAKRSGEWSSVAKIQEVILNEYWDEHYPKRDESEQQWCSGSGI